METMSGKVIVQNNRGRLGNKLFRFAVGWVLARRANVPLGAEPIVGFPGTQGYDVPCVSDEPLYTEGHRIDLEACERHLRDGTDVVIRGWHQRYEILRPLKQDVKQMFQRVDCREPEHMPGKDDVVVSIRLGDYFWPENIKYYAYSLIDVLNAVKELRCRRIWYVTDEPSHPFIRRLEVECEARLGALDPLEQFVFIRKAKRLVITPSTFSWWAAWLSQAELVLFPRGRGIWGINTLHADLWVDDEARYIAY